MLHTSCRQWSYPEPINRVFRLGLCQMNSARSYFCALLLLVPVPTWPRSFASGDSWPEIFVNKCQERRTKRLVASDEIASALPPSCIYQKNWEASLLSSDGSLGTNLQFLLPVLCRVAVSSLLCSFKQTHSRLMTVICINLHHRLLE